MPGLLRGVARTAVVAGTATAVSNRVSRRQAGRWAQQDYTQQAASQQQAPAPQAQTQAQRAPSDGSPDDMADRIAQLKELSELKAQGALTEEEFEAQKRRVLG
ncbi:MULTISPECIES: SHOCT domain-containing protein [unclassified Streptomyces]|uniref:SHOCT domain-containing protein n=1 Tax=unclassified Streptomyces TaxID=2593676 RepID=UPI001F03DC79|nr:MULTISPECIES: SHOCT domain-containing protein [unclassified Streptomyces]MCH0563397.1 SHOCT domain-containing protein [Streptomyces sp. MUM 2J]MCH0571495.1 SHOCT domain-containing protein [Streptomyces sp. MUM 136J]